MNNQRIVTILEELGEIIANKNIMLNHYKREADQLKRKLQEIENKEEQRKNEYS